MELEVKKFDWSIKQRLSDLLQKTRLFQLDEEWGKQFSFACVVQDRFKDAIEYLDLHLEPPKSRNELYLFMVYADNVFSAVQEFFELGKKIDKDNAEYPYQRENRRGSNFRFFKDTFKRALPNIPEEKIPTDDDFFKYFRALSFAHPYETSRQIFIDRTNKEVHYSPFPLIKNDIRFPVDAAGDIGVVVYSNGLGKYKTPTCFNITLRCSTIKDFLISRYEALSYVLDLVEKKLNEEERKLNETKINRFDTAEGILTQILNNLERRKLNLDEMNELIEFWKWDYLDGSTKNMEAIKKYKDAIRSRIGDLCDAIDDANTDRVYQIMDELLRAKIPDDPLQSKNGYRGLNYHYGNVISTCTSDDGNLARLKIELSYVMDGYAQKWVEIDADFMPNDVILKLLTIARFLEANSLSQKTEFNGF